MKCRLLVLLQLIIGFADSLQKQDDASRQRCSGMYSRKSWGGSVDPFILTKFLKDTSEGDGDPLASIVIFEWLDEPLIGRYKEGAPRVGATAHTA
jgi:hypothetical protein